ncbi:MAG: helix-turn-helix transcriptional regulator [Alloprevotella sp.]|nr:helix-turn-helix transcriptional regulator [Alloprevotella sp.]
MYRLRNFMRETLGMADGDIVSDEIFCLPTDAESTYLTNRMPETLDCYTFTLVRQGSLTLLSGDRELVFGVGDLYIYAPGFPISVVSASEDYHGLCLMADEQTVLEIPVVRSVIRAAYFPLVELSRARLHLSAEEAARLERWMQLAAECLRSDHLFRADVLRELFTLFLLDVMDFMEHSLARRRLSERTEALFVSFVRLLPRHFLEHHGIAFYADRLHITTTYLSRIVRQVTGRTVVDYINQMLLMEASWLLRSTDLPLADVAARLRFATPSSFSRFFLRMKGMTPKRYRMER